MKAFVILLVISCASIGVFAAQGSNPWDFGTGFGRMLRALKEKRSSTSNHGDSNAGFTAKMLKLMAQKDKRVSSRGFGSGWSKRDENTPTKLQAKSERFMSGAFDCSMVACDFIPRFCVDGREPTEDECCVVHVCDNGNTCWHEGQMITEMVVTEVEDCFKMCSCPDPFETPYDDNTEATCSTLCFH